MKRLFVLLIVALITSQSLAKIDLVTLPERDSSQLTIYNSADLTLVREQHNLTLKEGYNWLQLSWSNTLIDPTSLSLQPVEQADKIDIRQLIFPARTRQVGQWLIHSQIAGKISFEITYFTSGLSWRAFYMCTLRQDEKTMDLTAHVRVANNSGEDYENAKTRLIVGQVHLLDQIAQLANRPQPYGSPIPVPTRSSGRASDLSIKANQWAMPKGGVAGFGGMATNGAVYFDSLQPKEIVKEGLSEYFLYTIEGTETIPNQWAKRLKSFEANDIEVESLYKYDEQRYGNQAIRFVKFTNDEDHNLGETPLPNGVIRIYGLADEQGHLSYVGGTNVKYIPVDEEVELNLGPARLVKVEPKLMNFETENFRFDSNRNISGWDEIRTWRMEITNTRTLPVTIEITRNFNMSYWDLQMVDPASMAQDAVDYKKHDATHARFMLTVRPGSKKTFGYVVRTYHGIRQDESTR